MQTLTSFLSRVVSLGLGRGSREAEVSERQLQRDTYRNDAVNGSEILPGMCRTPRCPDHGSTRRDSEVGRGQLSHVSRLEIYPSTDNNRPDFLSDNVPSEIKRLRDLCQDLQQQLDERNENMKDLEEQAKKYCRELKNGMKDKCTKLKSHLAEREGEIASLKRKLARQEAETNSLKSDCQKLQHDNHHAKNEWQACLQNIQKQHISELNDLKSRWTADVNKHAQENDRLKRNLEELQADHVRSVNSIGTGLEPIADMTFEDRFRGLQEQLSNWCRRTFKKKPQLHSDQDLEGTKSYDILSHRFQDSITSNPRRVMEALAWGYIEDEILSPWFPTILPQHIDFILELEGDVRGGDSTDTHSRASFWRAYTVSLLFQNKLVQSQISEHARTHSNELCNLFLQIQSSPIAILDQHRASLAELLHAVMIVSAELRCQRDSYGVDENVQLNDIFDEARMKDVSCAMEAEELKGARVSAIISRGVVKTVGEEKVASVSKARVLVVKVEGQEGENEDKNEDGQIDTEADGGV